MSDRALVTFKSGKNLFSPYIYIKEGGDLVISCLKDDISVLQQWGGGVYAAGRFVWSFSNIAAGKCEIAIRNGPPPEAADWDATEWVENAPATADVFLVDFDAGEVHEFFRTIDPSGETVDLVISTSILDEETPEMVRALDATPLVEEMERDEQEIVSEPNGALSTP